MIFGLFRKTPAPSVPHDIYGAVMAQSRQRAFFADLAIPDTVMGRLEMLCLHMVLVGHRLAGETDPLAYPLSQEIFDAFTRDLDRTLREMGIGDTTVPKRKKSLVHAYYGQLQALAPALESGDKRMLEQRLAERFYQGNSSGVSAELAGYVWAAHESLARLPFSEISAGMLAWPSPSEATAGAD